jgi:enoyl-[acyl-carrier protein] reductase I
VINQNIKRERIMANGLLKGKKGIIFGALDEKSLAWKVAERAYEEGASLVLTNAPVALRFGQINALAEKTGAPVIPADATSSEELAKLIDDSINHFGGKVDFVLHSIGMSLNMRKEKHYTDLNYDFMHKTLDISAISFHRILHELYAKNAVADWGSIVALTYIAAQRIFPDYNEMADAKALLESISRNFGYHFGTRNKVRVNTISQSPTMTTAGGGVKGFTDFFSYADTMSPLGNAGGDAFADYCITLFSDLTRYVTMQNLFHDGGFSSMGINPKLLGVE